MNDLKRLTDEDAIGEHDRHPGEVCADIKPDREIGDAFRHLEYFLIVHSNILSGRHPIPRVDTQPSGLYRYSLRLPNQPKHKSPPNGLTDFLRGIASQKAGSQGGNVNDPAFSDYTSIFCLVH